MSRAKKALLAALVVAPLAASCANGITEGQPEVTFGTPDAAPDEAGPGDTSAPPPSEAGDDAGDEAEAKDSAPPKDAAADVVDAAIDAADASDASVVCTTVPPNNLCGLVPQCGCGVNQTCDVTNDQTGATSCITAGAGVQGAACTSTGNCALGLTCVFGACRPYCTTANQTCSNGGLCFDPQNSQGNPTPNRHVCSIQCDLRNPSAACPGNGCDWFDAQKVTDCRTAGTGGQDLPCNSNADCKPGFECYPFGPLITSCQGYCRIGQNGDCGNGTSCTDVFGANAPNQNGSKLGLCE
jgi:hypothetical protein